MSLDKAIEHGKEKRKPYYGSKSFDRTCRNHGRCPACLSNRAHKYKRRERMMDVTDINVENKGGDSYEV